MYRIIVRWSTNYTETHTEKTEEAAEKWLSETIIYCRRFGIVALSVNRNY